ncbi:MAG: YolD-like family protein [Firmicutes bacterium]|nr:YolD-like family protein [Bacillota bacterium]
MSDRGMKKWAPYASLIEQKGTIVTMKTSKTKMEKPQVSQDQATSINANLLIANQQLVTLIYFVDGKKIKETGWVKQIKFEEKWLKINEKIIYFSTILDLQIQTPTNSSPSLFNE